MRKFFVNSNQIENGKVYIIGEDVNHIKNVLRLPVEEELEISDEKHLYICKIKEFEKDRIILSIVNKNELKSSNVNLTIFQGLPKADKMELIIQKGTELGVSTFVPTVMERCIVKIDKKEENKKIDRWQKIAETASKQSKRDIIPEVKNIQNIKNVCNLIENYDIVLLAYEDEKINTLKNELKKLKEIKENYNIAVIIGPEGGIDKSEVDMLKNAGAKVITLGNRILRTETVALSVSSIIMYELEV